MTGTHDYADNEVKGLDRYFPTTLSRSLLIALLTLPVTAFWLIIEYSAKLMPTQEPATQNFIAVVISLLLAIAILATIVIDLVLVANHAKHRRIQHFSNQHPHMSFKWLAQNSTRIHYLFLLLIFGLGVLTGQHL